MEDILRDDRTAGGTVLAEKSGHDTHAGMERVGST